MPPTKDEKYDLGDSNDQIIETKSQEAKYGVRHIQVLMIFALFAIQYTHRSILSIAIVAMVDDSLNTGLPKFNWDARQQSYILSSFYLGYIVTQIPAATLAQRYGVKGLFLISTIASSILTILTPVCASIGGWKLLCAVRVLMGIIQGGLLPCFGIFITKWIPLPERGQLVAVCLTGLQFGIITSMSISGVIANTIGWSFIFYVSGAAGLVWSIFWFYFAGEAPKDIKYISTEEAKYIEVSCGLDLKTLNNLPIPWKKILSSVPVLCLILTQFCNDWGFTFLLTNIPTYIKNVLDFDITSNGLLSALPYAVKFVFGLFIGLLSDFLINNKYVTLSKNRKIFSSITLWGAMIVLIAITFVSKEQTVIAVSLLCAGVTTAVGGFVSIHVNHMDLSPNFAGILCGLTNFMATLASIISPLVAGAIIHDKTNLGQWQTMFYITSGVYFIGNLMFLSFGSAKVQPWNNPPITP